MQPESSQIIVSADGKCLSGTDEIRASATADTLDTLEIIIDGTKMLGGADSPTLLGNDLAFLPSSRQYSLEHFAPMPDGRCLARYKRRRMPDDAPEKELPATE